MKLYRYNQVEDRSDSITRRVMNVLSVINAFFGTLLSVVVSLCFLGFIAMVVLWVLLEIGVIV